MMQVISEKERYYKDFLERSTSVPFEEFLQGEELIDKRIIVYPGRLKDMPEYASIKKNLTTCGIVVMDLAKLKFMRFESANLDKENNRVYICENIFNSSWKYLRTSIRLGFRLATENDEIASDCECELVDLSYLETKTRRAYIDKNVICYKGVELTAEDKKMIGRRQSLLDNVKMKFYFSANGGFVHDKECDAVKQAILRETFE